MKLLKKQINRGLFVLIFAIWFIFSCDTFTGLHPKTAESAGDIVIGVVYTSDYANFFSKGVRMAVEEINQAGGILGRKIKTIEYDDMSDPDRGEKIAKKLVKNKDVVAVVGYDTSSVAIPVSVTFDKENIVFISYGATDPNLTRYGGEFIFRNIPDGEEFGRQIAELAHLNKFKKMVVFYERNASKMRYSENFKKQAADLGIEIVASRSFFDEEQDFRSVVATLKKKFEFDAVFIAAGIPSGALLIKQLREMGINVPVLGGDGLDSPDLWAIAGKASENTIVPTVFNPQYTDKLTRNFVKQFISKYGIPPDTWAAQGYDAVSVLAHAIEKSGSAVPVVISTTLRFIENWKGVTGSYSFTPEGDITGKNIFFKAMKNGRFVFLDLKQKYKSDLFNYIEDLTLRLPVEGVVSTIDPGFAGDATSIEIIEQLFLGLTDIDPQTYEAVPDLAVGWEAIEDGRTYIFHMRPDVTWTNGKPVTAHDVVWAIRRNIHPDTKTPSALRLYILKNAEAVSNGEIKDFSKIGVYARDDFTLIFELEQPVAFFPVLAGLPMFRPLPGDVIKKYKSQWTDPDNIQTNGSYKLVLWEKTRGIFLKKNPEYYDAENVSIPEVRYYVIPKSSVGLAMYDNNEIDIMGGAYLRLPFGAASSIKRNPALRKEYSEAPLSCTYGYAFNTRLEPVDNPLVRKAISAAIDRQFLIEVIIRGNEEPAATYAHPVAFGFVAPEEGVGIRFNPAQAQKWLSQAGYPGGKGFPEITLLCNESEAHEKIAQAIQLLLKHYLNIDIKLQVKDWNSFIEAIGDPPHIFRSGWCGDYSDADSWLSLFHPYKGFYNHWESREFAEFIDKSVKEPDQEQRKEFYKLAEQILCEKEAMAIPLYFEMANCLVKPRVKGWYHMPIGGQHIRDWYFEKK